MCIRDRINTAEKIFFNDQVIKSFKAKLLYKNKSYKEVVNLLENTEFLPEQIVQKQASYEVLAKSYDKVGDYGRAFKLFQMLNDIMDQGKDQTVDKKIYIKTAKIIKKVFTILIKLKPIRKIKIKKSL